MNKATKMIQYVLTKSAFTTMLNQYFGLVINNGTFGLDEISSRMQDGRPAIEDADVRLVARALADTVEHEVVVNHNKVDLGPIQIELAIDGSVPSLNSPLSEENTIYVAIYVADYLRREIEKIIPSRSTSDKVAVKIENVEDLSTHKKLVRGLGEFVITGSGLSAKREGEAVKLCTLDGEEAVSVTVLEREGMGERIYAKLPSAVPSGTYQLQLFSRGYYTPDAEPQMYAKKVSVEAIPPPPPLAASPDGLSKVMTLNGANDLDELAPVSSGGGFTMTGEGLARYVDAAPFLVWGEGDDEKVEISGIAAGSGGAITASIGSAEVVLPVGTTTCHLTFGDGDEAIDIGPFKVVRAE